MSALDSTVNSTNDNYNNNTAAVHGGVVYSYEYSILNSISDHFENNRAGIDGGDIYSDSDQHISVIKANAVSNVAESDGDFRLVANRWNQRTFELRGGNFSTSSAKRLAVIGTDRWTVKY